MGKKIRIIQIFNTVTDCISASFEISGASAKKDYATFNLSIGFNFLLVEIPSRKMFARFCNWTFKGVDGSCGYLGSDLTCEHTFEACKLKGNLPRFGGFPAILNERIYL